MLKREWGAENNGKLPQLFIPIKTATEVPEFAMEGLPLGRIAALVPELAVKDLPLGRTLMMINQIYRARWRSDNTLDSYSEGTEFKSRCRSA